MGTTTDLTTLKFNYLTQAQYEAALAQGLIEDDEFYLTPAQDDGYTAGYGISIVNKVISVNLPNAEGGEF